MHTTRLAFSACIALTACGGGTETDRSQPQPASPAQTSTSNADHGARLDLGTLTVAGRQFGIVKLGEILPGKEGAFEVQPKGMTADEIARLNLYLWVEDRAGAQLSAPSKGLREGESLHFHVQPREGSTPVRVVLRLRTDGTDERAGLPLDGHGHEHLGAPHDGVAARFRGGDVKGHLELKLHDDKGDLELWLAHDERLEQPFDLPLETVVEVELVDVGGRKAALRPRNNVANEDEAGRPNVRNGRTNYFVFPAQGEDAAWLRGKEFRSIAVVRFTRDGVSFTSEEFVLKPHTH